MSPRPEPGSRPAAAVPRASVSPPQEDVPGAEGERVGAGPQRHVLLPAGLRGGRRAPLEVRERGVGAGREAGAAGAQLRLYPPRLPQLRRPLDEGARLLQQSQTHQQAKRRRAGKHRHRDCPSARLHRPGPADSLSPYCSFSYLPYQTCWDESCFSLPPPDSFIHSLRRAVRSTEEECLDVLSLFWKSLSCLNIC